MRHIILGLVCAFTAACGSPEPSEATPQPVAEAPVEVAPDAGTPAPDAEAPVVTAPLLVVSDAGAADPESEPQEHTDAGAVEPTLEPEPSIVAFRVNANPELVQVALDRWVAAACLPLAISEDGPHEILFTTEGFTHPSRYGQTTGRWQAATIRIRWMDEAFELAVLMHELAHLFAMTNDHVEESVLGENAVAEENSRISEELLGLVCARQNCGCFNPESFEAQP